MVATSSHPTAHHLHLASLLHGKTVPGKQQPTAGHAQAVAAGSCNAVRALSLMGASVETVANYSPPWYLGEDKQCWEADEVPTTYCLWPCHCLFLHPAVQEVSPRLPQLPWLRDSCGWQAVQAQPAG